MLPIEQRLVVAGDPRFRLAMVPTTGRSLTLKARRSSTLPLVNRSSLCPNCIPPHARVPGVSGAHRPLSGVGSAPRAPPLSEHENCWICIPCRPRYLVMSGGSAHLPRLFRSCKGDDSLSIGRLPPPVTRAEARQLARIAIWDVRSNVGTCSACNTACSASIERCHLCCLFRRH